MFSTNNPLVDAMNTSHELITEANSPAINNPRRPGSALGRKSRATRPKTSSGLTSPTGSREKWTEGGRGSQLPSDGANSFEQGTAHETNLAVELDTSCGAVGHTMRLRHDTHQAVDGNHRDVEHRDVIRGNQREHLRRQFRADDIS